MVSLFPLLKKQIHVSQHSKRILYNAYLRPIMTYACPVWANCAKSHILHLQRLQNKILRMVLNAEYNTKIAHLHHVTKQPYINDFINNLSVNFYNKAKSINNNFIKNLGNYSTVQQIENHGNKHWTHYAGLIESDER
jgi:hypothetical protein